MAVRPEIIEEECLRLETRRIDVVGWIRVGEESSPWRDIGNASDKFPGIRRVVEPTDLSVIRSFQNDGPGIPFRRVIGGFYGHADDTRNTYRWRNNEARGRVVGVSRVKVQILCLSVINGVGHTLGTGTVRRRGDDRIARLSDVALRVCCAAQNHQLQADEQPYQFGGGTLHGNYRVTENIGFHVVVWERW